MEVHPLPAAHDGLVRYRITMPERPGRFAVLEVPADADDQVGLVELFAGSHQSLLEWVSLADEADEADEACTGSARDYRGAQMPDQRHALAAG